jgi:hypothetical protein
MQLLEAGGFYDIHLIHGNTEFGKDVIAKKEKDSILTQFSFQLKAGDINLVKFRNEIKPQLIDATTNRLAHPNFDTSLPHRVIFVCSGNILSTAAIDFQEFNIYVEEKLKAPLVETWDRPRLTKEFLTIGIGPFFELHNSPEQVGKFFQMYSKISNDELLDVFEIENYTKIWMNLEWDKSINRLQIFFEAYFFSRLLFDRNRYYESALMLSGLVRVLLKWEQYDVYSESIQEYYDLILNTHFELAEKAYIDGRPFLMEFQGVFSVFYHPISCLRTLELLSLYILTSKTTNIRLETFFLKMLDEQQGCHRIISDNYAISVVLVSLTLMKLEQLERLRKYLNNVCVWLCDRHEELGIAPIGSNHEEELEQLLSEYLSGLPYQKRGTSFAACILLDLTFVLREKTLFEQIANDLRAAEIILEFYHVLNDDALYTHDDPTIVTSTDFDFSLDFTNNYSVMIQHERDANKITSRKKIILFLIFLLRDRYFPTFIQEMITGNSTYATNAV